jgi:hypothetical protein
MTVTLGQIAFEAYRTKRGGINHDGTPTPTWDMLTPEIREAWEVSAKASVDGYLASRIDPKAKSTKVPKRPR